MVMHSYPIVSGHHVSELEDQLMYVDKDMHQLVGICDIWVQSVTNKIE
jgi:hypothetical protein